MRDISEYKVGVVLETESVGGAAKSKSGMSKSCSTTGGDVTMNAGTGSTSLGGKVTMSSGVGSDDYFVAVDLETANAGSTGVSGAMSLSTGDATAGNSGVMSLTTGSAVGGTGGAITVSVGSSDTGVGGAVTVTAGSTTTGTGGDGGAVSLTSGSTSEGLWMRKRRQRRRGEGRLRRIIWLSPPAVRCRRLASVPVGPRSKLGYIGVRGAALDNTVGVVPIVIDNTGKGSSLCSG